MTLVLPVPSCGGGGVRPLATPSNNDLVNNNSCNNNHRNKLAMPCGFDGEPIDFESALMLQGDFGPDWSTLKTPWSSANANPIAELTTTAANPFPSSNIDGAKSNAVNNSLNPSILRTAASRDSQTVSTESSTDSNLAPCDDTLMESCQEQSNKRKAFLGVEELTDQTRLDDCVEEIPRKRCRTESIDGLDAIVDSTTSRDDSVTSLADDLPLLTNTSPPLPLPSPPKDTDPPSPCVDEDDLFTPRRRVPMLWSPRLRLKDERRRVLKMSLSKLRKIEDPELFLRRSVLVNNTMKRLQREIRDERFAKYHQSTIQDSHHHRHPLHHSHQLSYGMDVQINGLGDTSSSMMCKEVQNHSMTSSSQPHYVSNLKQASCWGFDNQPPEDGFPNNPNKKMVSTVTSSSCSGVVGRQTGNAEENNQDSSGGSSSDEGSSCDEMFGINEDFLRIHIPKSPPTPVNFDNNHEQNCSQPSMTSSSTQQQQQRHDQNLTSNVSKIEQHNVNQLDCVRVGHVHLSSIERVCDSSQQQQQQQQQREHDSRMLSLDTLHHHHHTHHETDNKNGGVTSSRDDVSELSRTTLESLNNCANRYMYDHLGTNQHHASTGQCSTQYRTLHHLHHGQQHNNNNHDSFGSGGHCGNGTENSYSTPGMPILDSVVYHSLLASLDT